MFYRMKTPAHLAAAHFVPELCLGAPKSPLCCSPSVLASAGCISQTSTSAGLHLSAPNGRGCWENCRVVMMVVVVVGRQERRKLGCFSSSSILSNSERSHEFFITQLPKDKPARIPPAFGCDSVSCPLVTVSLLFVSPV